MQGRAWHGLLGMIGLSACVAMLFHELVRKTVARTHRWEDVRGLVRWASAGLGFFGVLFYLALLLHIFGEVHA